MTKIEEVARAIWQARRDFIKKDRGWDLEEWGDGTVPKLNGVMEEARAAIMAMHRPTSHMLAGSKRFMDSYSSNLMWWETMIDAALTEDK